MRMARTPLETSHPVGEGARNRAPGSVGRRPPRRSPGRGGVARSGPPPGLGESSRRRARRPGAGLGGPPPGRSAGPRGRTGSPGTRPRPSRRAPRRGSLRWDRGTRSSPGSRAPCACRRPSWRTRPRTDRSPRPSPWPGTRDSSLVRRVPAPPATGPARCRASRPLNGRLRPYRRGRPRGKACRGTRAPTVVSAVYGGPVPSDACSAGLPSRRRCCAPCTAVIAASTLG